MFTLKALLETTHIGCVHLRSVCIDYCTHVSQYTGGHVDLVYNCFRLSEL